VGGGMSRHPDNFEGAFPLLLIGSALLVYAGFLASQEFGAKSGHLPLWGLLGGVGAVIVGAGIYSTFLEPGFPAAAKPQGDWVTAPNTEWDAVARARHRTPSGTPPQDELPIWWEGSPEPRIDTASSRLHGTRERPRGGDRRIPETPRPTARDLEPVRPFLPPRSRYSLKELNDRLSELETLVNSASLPAVRGVAPSGDSLAGGTASCMDCATRFPADGPAARCNGCGRGLCASCAASSRMEDGVVRCVACRARDF